MRNTKGFTLIEVMIVVVVIAILATIAFPSYQESIRKSRRAEAKTALLQAAQILERCFTEFNTYIDPQCDLIDAGGAFIDSNSDVPPFQGEGYYAIDDTDLTANTFEIRATARNVGAQDKDTHCTNFTLDEVGVKNATNNDCW